ncbi:hypothetical protein UCRPC4_g04647 [Phaeomoniella chlamydospora]|uniref:Uncharacterized protein n=1 Tax=Phaeomoniella chlamydospora TaxID=158046 RepID=A0A0G2E9A0_PHACM|nr:hypothetical protein UCRPC4_g04647 [Phaeomoniella chlamydospora]
MWLRIAEGNFYEAHQQLRVIASRYLKSQSTFANAADILSGGAKALLQAGQGGSGGDLALMLVNDVYVKGEWEVNDANRKRLLDVLKDFPREEPTRKRYVQEIVGWSARFGEVEMGDPEIHHVVGEMHAKGWYSSYFLSVNRHLRLRPSFLSANTNSSLLSENNPYDAERHLLLGTSQSPNPLSTVLYTWYTADSPHTAPLYLSRAIFPYLLLGNLSSATKSYQLFTSHLTSSNPTLFTQSVSSSKSDMRVFPSLPLLNFLGLLLLSCQKGQRSLFTDLAKHYATHLKEKEIGETWGWNDALAGIGELWFGIRIPRQMGNPLMDMMGSMFFGGGGANTSGGSSARSGTPKPAAAQKTVEGPQAPPTMDLD